jgi:hypothetical protein
MSTYWLWCPASYSWQTTRIGYHPPTSPPGKKQIFPFIVLLEHPEHVMESGLQWGELALADSAAMFNGSEGGKYTSATPLYTCLPPRQNCFGVAIRGKQVHLVQLQLKNASSKFKSNFAFYLDLVYSNFRNYAPPPSMKRGAYLRKKVFSVFSERVFWACFDIVM